MKHYLIVLMIPVATIFGINLMIVTMIRMDTPNSQACKMTTLLEYFPTHWAACELTKPRFEGK